jgi:hypothetical protein
MAGGLQPARRLVAAAESAAIGHGGVSAVGRPAGLRGTPSSRFAGSGARDGGPRPSGGNAFPRCALL